MKAQDIATRAEILHAELSFLLSLEPEKIFVFENFETKRWNQLSEALSFLREINDTKRIAKDFIEELS